jgi:hypothetical protein
MVYGYYDWNETTAHSYAGWRLRWQNVLQIIDLVATDQLIIGKKNSLDTQQQYYTEE